MKTNYSGKNALFDSSILVDKAKNSDGRLSYKSRAAKNKVML